MGNNPSNFKGSRLPVESISWNDCQDYLSKLNKSVSSSYKFSLPTESQWEYACRAGTTTPFNFGVELNGDKANCDGNYPYGTETKGKYLEKTTVVGSYAANSWGIYDMHGNVWEWCKDWSGAYPSGSVTDPTGAINGSYRVYRGGGWSIDAEYCRSALRILSTPSVRNDHLGARLVLVSEN
jgi:formylglycine-generating enzyme required for sulfatase activity